ncbi:MAG: hypothetical protein AAFX05_09925 [Planctomycetota bacterium]
MGEEPKGDEASESGAQLEPESESAEPESESKSEATSKSKVDRFMTTEKGQEMTYRIAFDTGEHAAADFMQAAGQGGIPTAFVIDRTGKIAWIGHPEGGLEEVLAAVIKGDFDPIKFAEEQERMMQQAQALHQRFGMAMNNEDWDSVISIADEMLALNDKWFADRAVWKYIALIKDGRVEEAKKWAAQVASTLFHKDANQLNMFSWAIVGPDSMLDEKEVDTALGLRLAERANELTKSEDASILDTVARAHYVSGDLKAAIKYQTMAVDAAGEDSPMTTSLSATLKAYTDEAGDT